MARSVELLRFNALRNALYHTARRRTFERWSRVFNFAVVVLGAAAFAELMPLLNVKTTYAGGLVAVIGATQLVFDFGGQARTHQGLQRDYLALLAEIEEHPSCDDDACRRWEGKLVRITADEPPVLRALDAKAYNDAIDAMDWDQDERLIIPIAHRFLGTIFSFEGVSYKKVKEARLEQSVVPAE